MITVDHPRALLSLALLVLGTMLSCWALRRPRWEVLGAALAAAGVTAWTLINDPPEGAVLLTPFPGNGLTAAYLLSGPAVLLGSWLCWRAVRR